MLRLRETARGDDGGDDVVLKWRQVNGERRVFNDVGVGGVIYVYQAINQYE